MAPTTAAAASSFYDCRDKDMDGNTVSMAKYRGRVVVVVNVASYWGYTQQYAALKHLSEKYQAVGLSVLAFPCNQFAAEEPGTHAEILQFVAQHFGSDIVSKLDFYEKNQVNGPHQRHVYQYLKQGGADISWNFEKFLIDREGNVVRRYPPKTSPMQLEPDITALLHQKQQQQQQQHE